MEIPKSKPQNPNKFQIPITNRKSRRAGFWSLKFWFWNLFGFWGFDFGISARLPGSTRGSTAAPQPRRQPKEVK
jgi:hypothetical protein